MKTRQQGDVLLKQIAVLPLDVKVMPRKNGRIEVMHGEQGHTHTIADLEAIFYEKEGKFYLQATKPVNLVHEEHHAQVIEPGIWEISQVREYDYFQEMTRKVID